MRCSIKRRPTADGLKLPFFGVWLWNRGTGTGDDTDWEEDMDADAIGTDLAEEGGEVEPEATAVEPGAVGDGVSVGHLSATGSSGTRTSPCKGESAEGTEDRMERWREKVGEEAVNFGEEASDIPLRWLRWLICEANVSSDFW